MPKTIQHVPTLLISSLLLAGCVSSKDQVFGGDMPTMVDIHHAKFNQDATQPVQRASRAIHDAETHYGPGTEPGTEKETEGLAGFQWLPNPVMTMYVTAHLTQAGQPVPGYRTMFRLYTTNHLALPGESKGWD